MNSKNNRPEIPQRTGKERTQFKPGQSGNPGGRPQTHIPLSELRKMLGANSKAILQQVIDQAIEGDTNAQRLLIDKILPKAKDTMAFAIPDLTHSNPDKLVQDMFLSMSGQEMTADEVKQVLDLIRTFKKEDTESKNAELLTKSEEILKELREKYKSDV